MDRVPCKYSALLCSSSAVLYSSPLPAGPCGSTTCSCPSCGSYALKISFQYLKIRPPSTLPAGVISSPPPSLPPSTCCCRVAKWPPSAMKIHSFSKGWCIPSPFRTVSPAGATRCAWTALTTTANTTSTSSSARTIPWAAPDFSRAPFSSGSNPAAAPGTIGVFFTCGDRKTLQVELWMVKCEFQGYWI